MTDKDRPIMLPAEIASLLARLRRRIRLYVWAEGLAALLALLGAAFWVGLLIDWGFEPSRELRAAALITLAAVSLYVAYRFILRRIFARLSSASMAVLLERRFDRFQDSLLTSVEMSEHPEHRRNFSEEMLTQTSQEALAHVNDVPLAAVFNFRPLLRKSILAALLIVSIVTFGVLSSEAFAVWMRRLALDEQPWPRKTRLVVEGFEQVNGVRREKIAREGSCELIVKADMTYERIPDVVEIRYRLMDGTRGRDTMAKVGRAMPGRDDFQLYRYSFEKVDSPIVLDVVGGDARVRDLHIEVVERPQITEMALWCEYPRYMKRTPQRLSVTGAMQIPEGTRVTIRGQANKELALVKTSGLTSSQEVIDLSGRRDRRKFEFPLSPLTEHVVMMFRLVDDDAIENLEPYRLALNVAPDEPPQVAIQLRGIGSAISPLARIPVVGAISDDYGLDHVEFMYHVDEGDSHRVTLGEQGTRKNKITIDAALDAREFPAQLRLQPKQRLSFSVTASDFCDLGESERLGESQRFVLQVVSPEQLQILLQKRELELRRRFETIYADMVDTRDMLARVEFSAPKDEPDAADSSTTPGGEKTDEPPDTTASEDSAREPGDVPARRGPVSPERALARRKLRIMRAVQNAQRAAHETLAVAVAFDELYQELVNNRIDTEELKSRLQNDISAPLKRVGNDLLPELENRFRELERSASDLAAGPELLRQATTEADKVLVEMKAILDRMLELESYNEVVELLRELIQEQEELSERTRQQRRQDLKGLLEQ